jgi:hypothetical protein
MRDELFDRDYQNGRADLHKGVDELVRLAAGAFQLLHRIEWSAPWDPKRDRTGVA